MKKILLIFLVLAGFVSAQNSSQSFYVSTNSTVTLLDSAGVFTGRVYPTQGYNSLFITVISDVGGTIEVQYGDQSGLTLANVSYRRATYTAGDTLTNTFTFPIVGRHFRVVYTNSTTTQTSFSLKTFLSESVLKPEVSLSTTLTGVATEASLLVLRGYDHPASLYYAKRDTIATTAVDTIDVSTSTVWHSLSVFAVDDELQVSVDGTNWVIVPTYTTLTLSKLSSVTFTEFYVKQRDGSGNVIYDVAWIGY